MSFWSVYFLITQSLFTLGLNNEQKVSLKKSTSSKIKDNFQGKGIFNLLENNLLNIQLGSNHIMKWYIVNKRPKPPLSNSKIVPHQRTSLVDNFSKHSLCKFVTNI